MIRFIALALVALIATPTLAADTPPPVLATDAPNECRATWRTIYECFDRRSGKKIATCRFDHVAGKWACHRS
ncbi:MAG: hypothetical protein J0H39_03840 [Alphaproteobacteria bacterium]|nr:hypothetical protein [Alphaproteobacteria bacterium]